MEYSKWLTSSWSYLEQFKLIDTPITNVIVWLICAMTLFGLIRSSSGLIERKLQALAQVTANTVDDAIHDFFQATHSLFLLILSLYLTQIFVPIEAALQSRLLTLTIFVTLIQIGRWLQIVHVQILAKALGSKQHSATGLLTTLGSAVIWIFIVLIILSNFGINVSALLTGLGIGGIAIALAVQTLLGDLLASLSIVLDKPFEVGDFIITGDILGVVERIGLKTTRIRSVSGEQWILPNSDLIGSRVRNFKRMHERRVVITFGVTYQTPLTTLQKIPALVKEIILSQAQARFDRAHFSQFGPSSLDFEVVFYLSDPDYNLFMDVKQQINYALLDKLAELKVDFAYPTQTVHVHQQVIEKRVVET